MLTILRNALLAVLVAAGAAASLPAAASADSLYVGVNDGNPSFGIYAGEGAYRPWHRDDGWDRGRDPRWGRGGYPAPRCSPDGALFKAARLGFQRVWVSDVDWRTISVSGSRYGRRATVTFARAPFCPVIAW